MFGGSGGIANVVQNVEALQTKVEAQEAAIKTLESNLDQQFWRINERLDAVINRFDALGVNANRHEGDGEQRPRDQRARGDAFIAPVAANFRGRVAGGDSSDEEEDMSGASVWWKKLQSRCYREERGSSELSPRQKNLAIKVELMMKLQGVLQCGMDKIVTERYIDVCHLLKKIVPSIYKSFVYRRLIFLQNLKDFSLFERKCGHHRAILNEELKVVENALRRNFKSYGAWEHRKWVLRKEYSSVDQELQLLDQFQKADSRNFHAWNYRRFVAKLKNLPAEEELKYATNMIESNFSNYSAWHNRSVILSHLLREKSQGFDSKHNVLKEEYYLVHQALFTDPDDQSGWFYHLWILAQTVAPDAPSLISSWPAHGLDLVVSSNGALPLILYFDQVVEDLVVSSNGALPLILYFDQVVEGVNSSTVTVKYTFCEGEDLIWKPLSVNYSGKAQAWMTYLKFPEPGNNLSEVYTVEVSLGQVKGVISSSGSSLSLPLRFTFTMRLQSTPAEHNEEDVTMKMLSWKDENFCRNEVLQYFNPSVFPSDLNISEDGQQKTLKWKLETINQEVALFQDLLGMNCKIGKLTLARLLLAQDSLMLHNPASVSQKTNFREILELFRDLMKLDPTHSRFYKDKLSVVLMEEVVSDRNSLEGHCWFYGTSTSSLTQNIICLRLDNLSLSRIGSFENLLWVQMIDLRENELRSIEGLEVLQRLTCLNLSHNKLSSFTALAPLRLLSSLRVLDISYNEIGAHSIDTTRYLCSSPLSHSARDDCNLDEYAIDNVDTLKYWEAVLVFRDLQLTQLDVVGNAVSDDDKFSLLLVKILPKLKWLDGKAVC
ncbi:hypothetical protein Sjap_017118 [Stephania japonica]|uniref:Geranylgeranyl transferase type-2 subunit alpha n=1 Tax=Stephania japonica TaxID=461633 RepID=A0AAP0NJ21_9MAGN